MQTGYSRALPGANGAPGDPAPWFEAEADLRSIAQFIRRYLTQNNRWLSPKAIAGESYGGLRVAALSRLLMEEYDINLNRAVLISPLLKTTLPPEDSRYNLVSSMTMLPSQAAIAAAHRRNGLPADPAQASRRRWPASNSTRSTSSSAASPAWAACPSPRPMRSSRAWAA